MDIINKDFFKTNVTLRITALWAFSEAFMGGILHGLQIPFAGLVLGFVAAVCITLIALGNTQSGEILKATLLVIAVKFILSPHTPPMAYLAVLIQGAVGELLFLNKRFFKLAAFILTAEKQAGKTTLLQQFCKGRKDVAGILTPLVNSKRFFYDITTEAYFEMEAVADEAQLLIGNYVFSAAAFKKANDVLLQESKRTDINYLIIDEIGPLETKYQQGFYQTLISILQTSFNYNLLLVARPSLIDEVLSYTAVNKDESIVMTLSEMSDYLK